MVSSNTLDLQISYCFQLPFLLGCPNSIISEPIFFQPLSKALAIYSKVSAGGVFVFTVLSVPGNHPELVLYGIR